MKTANPPVIEFWQLPGVIVQIKQRIGTVHQEADTPDLWMVLQAGVQRSILDDDTRRRNSLLILFAGLIQQFRTHVEGYFGPGCWEHVRKAWENDNRRTIFLQFLEELSLAAIEDSLVALIHLRRDGLAYLLPGGRPSLCTPFDCGIDALVTLMREMESLLQQHARISPGEANDRPVLPMTRHVTIRLFGDKSIEVRFEGKPYRFKQQQAIFLLLLKGNPSLVHYQDIWDHLEIETPYVPDKGGPPALLRKLKSKTDLDLIRAFGLPPNGRHWILRDKFVGYGLNRNNGLLIWSFAKEGREQVREFVRNQADRST
jgi:hypothetical protein